MEKINTELQNALDKELSLMKNDFYYQQLETLRGGKRKIVRMDAVFQPLDVLGGDSYSLRKTKDGKVAFFILDAMGKGISASITAATTTSLLNYIFDNMKKHGTFKFKNWIESYLEFVKNELLDNEMIAIFFGLYDKEINSFKYASFGMPASLIYTSDNKFIKVKSNNSPISQYTDLYKTEVTSIKNMKKVLIYTDGLCETALESGRFYRDKMYQDFIESKNLIDFKRRVEKSIKVKDDDILYFYIDTIEYKDDFNETIISPNMNEIHEVICTINEYAKQNGAKPKEMSELSLALNELLLNAMEHGAFDINESEKHKLIEHNVFETLIDKLQIKHKDKNIIVNYIIKEEAGAKIMIVRIDDGGNGFDTKTLRKLAISPQNFNGRGVMIVKKLLDRFYYNEKGNIVTIVKFLTHKESKTACTYI